MPTPHLSPAPPSLADLDGDALVLVLPGPVEGSLAELALPPAATDAVRAALAADAALARGAAGPVVIAAPGAPGGRVVLASASALEHEAEDARSLSDTVAAAVTRAVAAGARRPVIYARAPDDERYAQAVEVTALAALGTSWEPLEVREARSAEARARLEAVKVVGLSEAAAAQLVALEEGRALARDLTGADPERMAPTAFAALCRSAFVDTPVGVRIDEDVSGYPLLAAVARASQEVRRHRPCVVTLTLEPEGAATHTLFVAGKGVTYDTGGADLKTDGAMAGMSRDKGGAGSAAGLALALSRLRPAGLRLVVRLGLVRNSVGADAFVSDEVLIARSGKRVRVGNTDAEGRLVLADLLAHAREEAASAPSPQLVSLATLTGHAYRAFGPLTAGIENAASRRRGFLAGLAEEGERWGEPVEHTRPRREDYAYAAARTPVEDTLSSNRLASVSTPRGHQGPFAFLDVAAGLAGTGLPFAHLDIAGSVVSPADWQVGRPTGAPIAALTALFTR